MDEELIETNLVEQQAENFSSYLTQLDSLLRNALAGNVEVSRDGTEVTFEITSVNDPIMQPFTNIQYWQVHIRSSEGLYNSILKQVPEGAAIELENQDDNFALRRKVRVSF